MQQLSHAAVADRRLRPHNHHHHLSLKCPRCDSPNTKFCYYNNYNLSQPRHYCKSCRRYWTKGGVLRNVPVGGGCRKSKRSSKSKNDAVATTTTTDRKSVQNEKSASSESSSNKTTASESNVNPYGFSDPNLFNFNQAATTDGQILAEFGGCDDVANGTASFQVSGDNDGDGFGAVLDWGTGGGDQGGLFDLTAVVDPSYWSQTQWTDNDQSLNYLP